MPMPNDLPEKMVSSMKAFMEIGWLMQLVGFVEIVWGVLFIISRFRALGAIIISPIMVGIFLTNIITAPSGLPIAFVLLAINLWVIYENREKYFQLIKK